MDKNEIIKEAKRIEEDSIYSSKSHFYAAQFWSGFNLVVGLIITIISAIAGTSAFSQFDNHNIVSGALSILVAALVAITTFIDPNKKASLHKDAGNKYSALKNNVRLFYNHEIDSLTEDQILKNIKEFNNTRNQFNSELEQIPKWAFKKAKKGIEDGEAKYKIDETNKSNVSQ